MAHRFKASTVQRFKRLKFSPVRVHFPERTDAKAAQL